MHGVDGLNLGELAARAGFGNAASLYRYFSSKQEIVGALAARGLERSASTCAACRRTCRTEEQIVEICLAYLEYARELPRRAPSAAGSAPAARRRTSARRRSPAEFVRRMFRLGRDRARERRPQRAATRTTSSPCSTPAGRSRTAWPSTTRCTRGPERELLRSRHRAVFQRLRGRLQERLDAARARAAAPAASLSSAPGRRLRPAGVQPLQHLEVGATARLLAPAGAGTPSTSCTAPSSRSGTSPGT